MTEESPIKFNPKQLWDQYLAYAYMKVIDNARDGLDIQDMAVINILWSSIPTDYKKDFLEKWNKIESELDDLPKNTIKQQEKIGKVLMKKLNICSDVLKKNGWLFQVRHGTDYNDIYAMAQQQGEELGD